jgi:hypothetical protein
MNPTDELYHSVLQKLIILFLSLLTVSVILTSCTSAAKSCAAYNGVEVHKHEQTTER